MSQFAIRGVKSQAFHFGLTRVEPELDNVHVQQQNTATTIAITWTKELDQLNTQRQSG